MQELVESSGRLLVVPWMFWKALDQGKASSARPATPWGAMPVAGGGLAKCRRVRPYWPQNPIRPRQFFGDF
jgi:hypothetical protein